MYIKKQEEQNISTKLTDDQIKLLNQDNVEKVMDTFIDDASNRSNEQSVHSHEEFDEDDEDNDNDDENSSEHDIDDTKDPLLGIYVYIYIYIYMVYVWNDEHVFSSVYMYLDMHIYL
jgi:hypothetical protein